MTSPEKGLRLALVSAFPPGRQSLNEYGLHLAREMAARDDVTEVLVLADILDSPQEELALSPKIRVERLWRFNSLTSAPAIARALRWSGVDGAVFNLQTATFGDREMPAALGLAAPLLARLSGTPAGVITHNLIGGIDLENTQLKGQRLRQALVRWGGALVTRALVKANYMTVTLASYQKMLADRHARADVTLVPHGTFNTSVQAITPCAERPMRIVTMGKFGTYKRLETLLAAFDILRRDPQFPGLELVIGGSDHPNAPGYLDTLAKGRAGDISVRFAGYVAEDDIPAFFGAARVSVFDYSATTGSSGVLHQTASYGTVPVFPHIGDFVDVCRDEGLNGAHYAPGNAEEMAQAIRSLLSNDTLSDAMAASNLTAARGMPFSEVVAFHVRKLTMLGQRASVRTVARREARAT